MTGPEPTAAARLPRERVLTWPLALFLLGVGAVLATALGRRLVQPEPAQAIRLLADGDLDGAERRAVLQRLVERGDAPDVTVRWAAALAAAALDDGAAFLRAFAQLGGGDVPAELPPEAEREWLHLGDPMLRNLVAAWLAEASGHRREANVHWRHLAAQCRYVPRSVLTGLASAGASRTAGDGG